MSTCINKNHPDVLRIAEELNTLPAVAAAKIGVWQENNNILDRFPSTEELSQPSQVNYSLKAVEILSSDKAKQTFEKGKKNGWDLNKILTELQIPKEQKQIITNKGITDREEIITSLLAENSFVVEINTAKERSAIRDLAYDEGQENITSGNPLFIVEKGIQDPFSDKESYSVKKLNPEGGYSIVKTFNSEKEAIDFKEKQFEELNLKPSQYYSNLTVPGGTNYTENEISTPTITPSIKGHAQFSTDNGIGWFRSDDKAISQIEKREMWNPFTEQVEEYEEERGRVDPTKTRRILELQSDLFQKGRDEKDLINTVSGKGKPFTLNGNEYRVDVSDISNIKYYKNDKPISEKEINEAYIKYKNSYVQKNQFLQLLNKNNNWVTFFVKATIQDSAKKGYEKVLFPKGDTAAKIEGHQTLEEFKKTTNERIKLLQAELRDLDKNTTEDNNWQKLTYETEEGLLQIIKTEGYEDIEFINYEDGQPDKLTREEHSELISNIENSITPKIETGNPLDLNRKKPKKTKEQLEREINAYKQELADVESGQTQLSSIANFYENTVTNILKKNGFNPVEITDEYGNKWNEITIKPDAVKPIWLSRTPLDKLLLDELTNFKDYFKIRTLDRVYEPNMFKGWKLRVEAINKRLGFEALQAVNYTPQGGKGRMRVKIKTEQPTTETRKITAVAYSNWFRMLPAEQKRSENALREQDGLPPLKVERQKLSPLQSETTEAADKKIAVLQKVFDVEVEYDSNLTDSEGNPVAGAVIPGVRPKIVLNPNRLAEDTVIHEFAHIFIDALGGLKNARVAAAVNKLKETELWAEVKEMYPELNENDLALEVLATAMGRRGSEIFEEETNATWWDNFVKWVTQRLAAWFKQDTDALEQITRDLFSKDNINLNLLSSGITQYSKTAQEAYARQKAIDKEKYSLQKLNDNALAKLRTKHQIIRNSPSQAEGYEGYEKKLKETIKEIETISKTSPLLGLHKFVEYASTQLKSVESTVDKIINNEEFNEFIISKIDLFTGIFDDIDDYSKAVADNKLELENLGIPVENLEATLKDLSYNRDRSKALLKDARKRIAARLLAQQSTYAQDLARQRYQVEANKAGLKGTDKERYIHEQLIKNKDSFYKENVDFYYNMMDTTLTDITGLEAWVLDAYNINSHTIQIVQSLISNADLQTRKSVLDDKADIAAATEEFTNSGMYTPSKKFDKLIQKASNGIYYLRSKYKSDFNIELRKLKQAVSDALDTDGKDSDKHKEASDNLIKWLQENTITKGSRPSLSGGGLVPNIVPTDKWLDPEYATLNAKELKYLEFVKNKLLEQDRKVPSHKKLQQWPGSSINNPIIQLPGIEAKTSEVLLEQGVFSYIKESAKRLVKKSAADEEVFGSLNNEVQKDKGLKSVFTYESGEQKKDIPIFYRTQPEKQSLDLPTLLLLNSHTTNNYNNKFKILTQVNLLVRATAEKEIGKSEGTGLRKLLVSSTTNEPVTMSGKESKEYKVLQSIVEDNIFGVNTIDLHSTFLGADVNTILKNLGKWTSDSMLILNYLSAGANVLQGKVMNALEARSGGTLKVNNLRNGESMFWADSQGWLGDVGRRAPKSKTSLLMDFFNVKGDYSALSTHFFKNSKAASLLSWDRAHFLNGMGEFYTAATLMYSTLDKIKVMNRNREYIDVNGKVVKTEAEAASLSDVYEVKDGKLQIMSKHQTGKNAVTYTSLDYENVYNPAVVSNYIKKIYSDLHGQYDGALQSMAQRTAIGKLAFMLRKWMLPGLLRRWRGISTATQTEVNPQDKFYSHALKQEMEGNYTTAIRFITKMKKSMKELKFDAAYRLNWDELNDFEKANIRRTALEMSIMVSTFAASVILLNLAKDMDDDEAAKTALMLTTFWTRRLYSEMSFYVNPGEMTRILRSPAATVSLIESSIRLITQIQRDILTYDFEESSWHMFELERYERGPRKNEPKVIKKVEQVVPVFKNIRRDVEEATDYLWNTF